MSSEPFPSIPVRQGIKMAIAGMLGFGAALWLRLPNPTWCIFTVIVLMLAQYVGAIAEKAVLRAVGTVVGATLGILLVGNFASDPAVMIVGSFLVAAFGTMMFGGNLYPYAFFLGALTTLVVVGSTMKDPANAWHFGMARILEITLGILFSTAVTSVVWPRYARAEFQTNFRAALAVAGRIAIARSRGLLDATAAPGADLEAEEVRFSTRMNTLRLLLRYGQRESEYFRVKLPIRRRMTSALGALFEAAESLGQRLPMQSLYRTLVSEELDELHREIEAEFRELDTYTDRPDPVNEKLTAAIARCEKRIEEVRLQGLSRGIPIEEAMDFSSHYVALLDICERLRVIRDCFHQLHDISEVIIPERRNRPEPFRITAFWIRNGIKGGLTAVAALAYVNWINPPGGTTVPFAAWLLTATSRMYPGGEGDRRAFSYVLTVAAVGIPYAALLLVIAPFLAEYFWLNVFLAIGLFALGFAIARQGGIGLYTQCGMLFFIGAIGLNAQEPVAFPQIVNVYFGVVIALVLSAIIQRLLWPVLPQREICALFAEFFAHCRGLIGSVDRDTLAHEEERIALIPPELAAWARVATTPEYPAGERERLFALLQTAERLGYCLLATRRIAEIEVPADVAAALNEKITAIEGACREALAGLEDAFQNDAPFRAADSPLAAFGRLEVELGAIRQRYLSGVIAFPAAIPYFGALNFLEEAIRAIDRCAEQVRGLRLDRYRGDYAL